MIKPVIALIGGVASGKSAVADALKKRGACVVDADAAGHEILHDPAVKAEIAQAFGREVFVNSDVDRAKLAAKVFSDAALLATLNAITHPRIRQLTQARIEAGLNDTSCTAVVLDVSLLLESGAYEGKYSLLVFVDATEDTREQRAMASRGWPKGEVARRQANQLSLEVKKSRADVVIDNNGTIGDINRQVAALWQAHINKPAAGGH